MKYMRKSRALMLASDGSVTSSALKSWRAREAGGRSVHSAEEE
jgi:hypothetical protein